MRKTIILYNIKMNNFNIITNSNDAMDTDIYNTKYKIHLESLIGYGDNKKYYKKYKVKYSFTSTISNYLYGRIYGLYLNNLTYNMKVQQNLNNSYLLGIITPKLTSAGYILKENYEDNLPVIISGLNNSSTFELEIKELMEVKTLEDGLLWWYKFNPEDRVGQTIKNHATGAFDGTLASGATLSTTTKKIGTGTLDLTLTNSAGVIPNIIQGIGIVNTFSCWIKQNPDPTIYDNFTGGNAYLNGRYGILHYTNYATGIPIEFFMDINVANQISFSGNGSTIINIDIPIVDNNQDWFYVTAIFGSGKKTKLYFNGNFIAEATTSAPAINGISSGGVLGRLHGSMSLRGYMDDVRMYNRELSATDIKRLYLQRTLEDDLILWYKFNTGDITGTTMYNYATGFNDGVLVNGATISTNSKVGSGCLDLSTDTEYMTTPNINNSLYTDGITVSFWVRIPSRAPYMAYTGVNEGRITFYQINTGLRSECYIDFDPIDLKIVLWYNGSSTINYTATEYPDLTENYWYHFTFINGNTNTHKLYINGKFVSSEINANTYTGSCTIDIGKDGTNYLNGFMDDFRIYGRPLTSIEIQQLYLTYDPNINPTKPEYNLSLNIEEI